MIEMAESLAHLLRSELPGLIIIVSNKAILLYHSSKPMAMFRIDGNTIIAPGWGVGDSFMLKYDLTNELELEQFVQNVRSWSK